jgi:hypothetical protein
MERDVERKWLYFHVFPLGKGGPSREQELEREREWERRRGVL